MQFTSQNEIDVLWVTAGLGCDGDTIAMQQNIYGRDARIIGEVKTEPQGIVAMRTGFGGTRIVDMLVGEQLPRIC